MRRLIYIGRFPEGVEVPLPLGGVIVCGHGETEKFPDSVAKSLLEQPANWRDADAKEDRGKGGDK